jgi:hypothetical protein
MAMAIIGVDGMPLVNKCTNSYHRENCERALCISKLSFVRLYRDRFSVTCSTEMFLTQKNISYNPNNPVVILLSR